MRYGGCRRHMPVLDQDLLLHVLVVVLVLLLMNDFPSTTVFTWWLDCANHQDIFGCSDSRVCVHPASMASVDH